MGETTTIRVSKNTIKILEKLRRRLGAKTLDETLRLLINQQRREILEEVFGADFGKVRPFAEEDRGESRD
ncbi:MAG: hypothetical protein N3D12_01340 [Candidatus Methanomethyliaceae archaeon]|nr:hypothetical protein [Candidatus Methanomethyliaceae archaeon]